MWTWRQRLGWCSRHQQTLKIASNHQKLGERHKLILHHSPEREPTMTIYSFHTFGLQNWETINFCCLSHPVSGMVVLCYGSTSRLKHPASHNQLQQHSPPGCPCHFLLSNSFYQVLSLKPTLSHGHMAQLVRALAHTSEGSNLGQDTYLGWGFNPWSERLQKAIDRYFPLSPS